MSISAALTKALDAAFAPFEGEFTAEMKEAQLVAFMKQHSLTREHSARYEETHWGIPNYPYHKSGGRSFESGVARLEGLCFMFKEYPACCGAMMLHNFSYTTEFSDKVTQKQFTAIMDAALGMYKGTMYYRNQRVITVMVEHRDDYKEGIKKHITAKHEPVDDPKMRYPMFWHYWNSKKVLSDRLMYNVNTGAILHDLEVIIN